MEFDDINRNPSHHETRLYENINITSAEPTNLDKIGSDEEQYEETEKNVKKSELNLQEDTVKRIKVIGSILFALLVALYIGVIALVIIIAVPNEQDGDGGWTIWNNWSTCSESCGGGITFRNRTCSNPIPSRHGKQCVGNSEQVNLCNRQACPEHNVAFTAYNLHRNSSRTTTLHFLRTYINNGNAYDRTTGKFTCKVPGVYHFVVTLIFYYQDIIFASAYLRIDRSNKLHLKFYYKDRSNEIKTYMLTGAGTFHLKRNDVVYVYGIPNYFSTGDYSYFTGFLITPDQ